MVCYILYSLGIRILGQRVAKLSRNTYKSRELRVCRPQKPSSPEATQLEATKATTATPAAF
jgi:hypothetical protein